MKKLLSILLAAMLLLSLAACGGKDDGDAADKLQGALGGVSEPASSAPTQADGTLLETEFWSVTYPEDWVYSEEDDMGISEGYYASFLKRMIPKAIRYPSELMPRWRGLQVTVIIFIQ